MVMVLLPNLKQIEKSDELVGQIWDKLESQGKTENMLNEMTITMAVRGKGVIPGEMKDANIRDVSAIFLHDLDFDIPENQTGIVPDNLFEGYEYKPRKEQEIVFDVDGDA